MTDQPTLRQRIARAILRYDSQNALSGNDIPSAHHFGEADFVLAELRSGLDALAALRAVARGYCPQCGRGDAAPTVQDWEAERQRADQAEERVDELAGILAAVLSAFPADLNPGGPAVPSRRLPAELINRWRAALDQPGPAATQATEWRAEDTVTRVIDLYEQWVKAGPPPLGTSMSRWWDGRLAELHAAINPNLEQ